MNKSQSLYIGLMSGTSLDGIDAVLTKIEASGDACLLDSVSAPFSPELRKALLDLQTPGPNEIHRENQAANALSVAYADVVKQLLTQAKLSTADISAIGAHGQTIRHQADLAHHLAYTHQTLNPALLAELTGIDVIADFRSRDLAAGGHGAPLVPAFHAQQFATDKNIAVLNLGGIANLTLLPKDGEVKGFDCGPGNMLMDAWIADQQGHVFDENGTWALQGIANRALLSKMMADPFFSKAPPKSTGRDDFHLEWLQKQVGSDNINAEDVQATLLQLTVDAALQALEVYAPKTQTLIICGGGARNDALLDLFKARAEDLFKNSLEIVTSDALGIDPQLVEGLAFAWLAWAHKEKRPANLPAVTGAKGPRILGACYPA
ncbi:anhydro-N-acetylmuramic acid kinase [Polynucleobacter sp. es-MAR-4]|uniref:anhydro-N-acetylmuramic acid kinase n=1 Tax=Polynucleobacter sp. es-MAR-4 TaxID=1855655 RepID=UPI001C0DEC8A|nr:anhydro-N-acetylmuramic acid kinase [Polynucleobacter sp. es-MAR-4]MBU3637064.1 anhydro-N-acetylmuramic acid kinase [Polynucleobacter sp. es-MAR-4]